MNQEITGIKIIKDDSYSILYLTKDIPTLQLTKKKPSLQNSFTLHCTNLKPNTKYIIKLWYGSNRRGGSRPVLRHPFNSIFDAVNELNLKEKIQELEEDKKGTLLDYQLIQRRCTGSVLGVFNTYECNNTSNPSISNNYNKYLWPENDNIEPDLTEINPKDCSVDNLALLRKYILQTEWEFTTGENATVYKQLIQPKVWLPSMARSQTLEKGEESITTYTLSGGSATRSGHLTFYFSIEEAYPSRNETIIFSDNQLYIGTRLDSQAVPDYLVIK